MVEENTTSPEEEVAAEETTIPAENTETADLSINDLAALKQIIDVASARGAFRPNEMVPVGTIYNKLEKFLDAAQKDSAAASSNNA
jgi:hypothetical protein